MRRGWPVLAAVLALALAACPSRPERHVLLLGLDAATLVAMEPLMASGELPEFRRLVDEGAHGELATLDPTLSVIIWTSIVTGHVPEAHGIRGWLSESGEQLAFSTDRIQRPPLWRLLTHRGIPSLFVGFWATWPAEEVVGGMVSNRMAFRDLAHRAYPPELQAALDALPAPPAHAGGDALAGKTFHEDDRRIVAMGLASLERTRPRLGAVYLRGLDICQHAYWHTVDPKAARLVSAKDDTPMVTLYYRYLDGVLGRLREAMPGATVVVVSDHGMEAMREAPAPITGLNMNKVLAALGHLELEGAPPAGPGHAPARRGVVWSGTRAYTFGDSAPDLDRGIRLNLEGREPHGVVPPSERGPLLERLQTELSAAATEDGRRLFRAVRRVEGAGGQVPDLVADINPAVGFADAIALGGRTVAVSSLGLPALNHNSGQHWNAPPGIIMMAGDGVKAGHRIEGASVYDVTPTVLALLGLPAGQDMAGKPLAAALTFAPPPPVPTWGPLPFRGPARREGAAEEKAGEATMEELRGLGYLQ